MPGYLKRYFWDVDFSNLHFKKHPEFIVERILEFGDERAVAWLLKNLSRNQIIDTLHNSNRLSGKSANFWALIFGVEREKVKCLSRSFRETRKQFWPY